MDTCIENVFEFWKIEKNWIFERFSNAFEVNMTHLLEKRECRRTTWEHLYFGEAKKILHHVAERLTTTLIIMVRPRGRVSLDKEGRGHPSHESVAPRSPDQPHSAAWSSELPTPPK